MRRTIVLLTMMGMMMPLAAHALNEHVWLMVSGGGGTYDMSEINQDLTMFNNNNPGTGFAYPMIRSGMSLGIACGFDAPHGWSYGLGLDRLHANSKASDASGSADNQFTANAWHAFAERTLTQGRRSGLLVGGGIGIIAETGKLIETEPNLEPETFKFSGSSPMYEAHAGGNWWLSPQFGLVATAGYRYARIKAIKIEGTPIVSATGENLAADYSGMYLRLGFKLAGKNVDD